MTIPLDAPGSRLPLPAPLVRDEIAYGSFCEFPHVSAAVKGQKHRCARAHTRLLRPSRAEAAAAAVEAPAADG